MHCCGTQLKVKVFGSICFFDLKQQLHVNFRAWLRKNDFRFEWNCSLGPIAILANEVYYI
jgi:hypothetical protein